MADFLKERRSAMDKQSRYRPVLAPVQDVVGHLLTLGHTDSSVSMFVSSYLSPLAVLASGVKRVGPKRRERLFLKENDYAE